MLILFEALSPSDRREAFQQLATMHERNEAGDESDTERMLRSINRVARAVGKDAVEVKITDYREQVPLLRADGEDIVPFSELYAHFDGRWSHVTQAIEMAEVTTPRRIEARFLSRRLGKVWRYTEEQLADTLEQCSVFYEVTYGLPDDARYAPLVAEFDFWREREFELARARGNWHFHLPSASPYRRRYGDWESALSHFGFTTDQLAERFARQARVVPPPAPQEKPTPAGLPIAEMADEIPLNLSLSPAQSSELRDAYRTLPPRTRYILSARLGLGGVELRSLKETAEPLTLHPSRIAVIQHETVGALAERIGTASHGYVVETLRQLSISTT